MLAYQAHDLLVRLTHPQARRLQVAITCRTVAVDMVRRRRRSAVGAGLVHVCGPGGRRQPAGPLARRPVPSALVARVSGGQAGPLRCTHSPRSSERRDHERARRIGLDALAE